MPNTIVQRKVEIRKRNVSLRHDYGKMKETLVLQERGAYAKSFDDADGIWADSDGVRTSSGTNCSVTFV